MLCGGTSEWLHRQRRVSGQAVPPRQRLGRLLLQLHRYDRMRLR